MSDRATIEELRQFANKVRVAGGGNPLDALMPAVPEDGEQCLIAKNLNFNCTVGDGPISDAFKGEWWMTLKDPETRDKIAEALGLETRDWSQTIYNTGEFGKRFATREEQVYGILLPKEIGNVARDFDASSEIASRLSEYVYDRHNGIEEKDDLPDESEIALLEEMLPYIEESYKEAYNLATVITEEGKIVL